jgi:PAS domain S-box-containing protein
MALATSDMGTTLALAVIAASQAPLIFLDGDMRVIATSTSFQRDFGINGSRVVGRAIFEMGDGEWNLPRLRSLLGAIGSGAAEIDAYELELTPRKGVRRQLLLNVQQLNLVEDAPERLLLTVGDVTEARAAEKLKNDLIREKDILLQEIQHRVANSLQIIASVLLQSVRKMKSDESRLQIRDAHNRLMSVAAVQKQLAMSRLGDVAVRPYLTQLCQSLGASMISDHEAVRIAVTGDDSATSAEISVGLGLIVTELVINALKHAFPGDRSGMINVEYSSNEDGWMLSVRDDGVGMATSGVKPASGLGTAIVQALATQLHARIDLTNMAPGTSVSVVHERTGPDKIYGALRAV